MNIERHLPELRRAIRNNKHEFSDSGVVVPSMGVFAGFSCETRVNGRDPLLTHNLLTLEGRRYLLAAAVTGGPQTTQFYIAPFTGDVTPIDNWTAANFTANATEFTGYTSANRVLWDRLLHATASSSSNAASPADVELAAGQANVTIRGFGLLTASPKSATTGVLISAMRHDRPGLGEGDTLSVRLTLVYQNAP